MYSPSPVLFLQILIKASLACKKTASQLWWSSSRFFYFPLNKQRCSSLEKLKTKTNKQTKSLILLILGDFSKKSERLHEVRGLHQCPCSYSLNLKKYMTETTVFLYSCWHPSKKSRAWVSNMITLFIKINKVTFCSSLMWLAVT